jgi:hypothetical protein
VAEVAVVPLADGRLQLWVNVVALFYQASSSSRLWSKVQTARSWNSEWTDWKPFELPGAPNSLANVAPAPLPTGQIGLWALGGTGDSGPVYMTMRQEATGDPTDPLWGWGPWSLFEVPGPGKHQPPPAFPPAQGLMAAVDGSQRTYLWVNANPLGQPQNNWKLTYSSTPGAALSWNSLTPFPTPASDLMLGNTWMSGAPLPNGDLQLCCLTAQLASRVVWTSWQASGQGPLSWTPWQVFQ